MKIRNPYADIPGFIGDKFVFVPCGHCEACICNVAQEWRVRLTEEYFSSETSVFVTLTYDDDKVPIGSFPDSFGVHHIVPYVSKRDVQLFFKRLRKALGGAKIRYFLASEYGPTTLRPHYHCVIFGLPRFSSDALRQSSEVTKVIEKAWSNGFVRVDDVTPGRISYVTKYLSCVTDLPEFYPKPFRLMSRNPGLGSSYLDNKVRISWHRDSMLDFYPDGKEKFRFPRYYRDKIFDDDMKSVLSDQRKSDMIRRWRHECDVAYNSGYNSWHEWKQDQNDKYIRKFNKQLKKSRKDV